MTSGHTRHIGGMLGCGCEDQEVGKVEKARIVEEVPYVES
jgi:hypothetical protein